MARLPLVVPWKKRRFVRFLVLLACAAVSAARAESFLREDWVISAEPTHPDYFGINHWGVTNFDLPYRVLQRGKHQLEEKYADNWRFHGETGGIRGVGMRTASTMLDFALFVGPQNFDHVMGHDSRSRELSRDYPGSHRYVSKRFNRSCRSISAARSWIPRPRRSPTATART